MTIIATGTVIVLLMSNMALAQPAGWARTTELDEQWERDWKACEVKVPVPAPTPLGESLGLAPYAQGPATLRGQSSGQPAIDYPKSYACMKARGWTKK